MELGQNYQRVSGSDIREKTKKKEKTHQSVPSMSKTMPFSTGVPLVASAPCRLSLSGAKRLAADAAILTILLFIRREPWDVRITGSAVSRPELEELSLSF
jgi:hypothetical protein